MQWLISFWNVIIVIKNDTACTKCMERFEFLKLGIIIHQFQGFQLFIFNLYNKRYFYKSSTCIYCCLSTIRRVWVSSSPYSTIIVDLHNFLWIVAVALQWTFKVFMIEYWFCFIPSLVYFQIVSHFKC